MSDRVAESTSRVTPVSAFSLFNKYVNFQATMRMIDLVDEYWHWV